jgi:hypothetical protein
MTCFHSSVLVGRLSLSHMIILALQKLTLAINTDDVGDLDCCVSSDNRHRG